MSIKFLVLGGGILGFGGGGKRRFYFYGARGFFLKFGQNKLTPTHPPKKRKGHMKTLGWDSAWQAKDGAFEPGKL